MSGTIANQRPGKPFSKWANPHFLPDLLPVIPPVANLSVGSKVAPEMLGKVPGQYLGNDIWCGFAKFTQHVATEADIAKWNRWPGAGVGLLARNHPAIDIDVTDPALADAIQDLAFMWFGPAPVRTGNAPKRLLLYRGAPMKKRRIVFESGDAVEILGEGQHFVVDGIHPKTEQPYEWDIDPATFFPEVELIQITAEQIHAFLAACAERAPVKSRAKDLERLKAERPERPRVEPSDDVAPLKQLLAYLDPSVGEDEWWPVIAAIEASPMGTEGEREAVALEWSHGDYSVGGKPDNWKSDADVRAKFQGKKLRRAELEARGEDVVGFGSLVKWAREAGMPWRAADAARFDKYLDEPGKNERAALVEPEDPFAPRQLNTRDKLDNHQVTVGWSTYGDDDESVEDDGPAELVPEWIEKWTHNINEGPGGLGKSYIKLQDAICLSAGHPIYRKPVEKVSAWYFNYEEPKDEFDRRVQRIRRALGDGKLLPLGDFKVRHLRQEPAAHILRVTANGAIIRTRFGAEVFDALAKQADQGVHTYLTFDGLMDAILFEGSTRMDDGIVRLLLAEMDRWCEKYDCTIASILHPSRAAERLGGGSYAPAWNTKPRSIQQFSRVTLGGKPLGNQKGVRPEHVFTRRFVEKRSHGKQGYWFDLEHCRGIFRPLVWNGATQGGEDPMTVAVDLACKQAMQGGRIKHDLTIGGDSQKLSNQHRIFLEYRRRTGLKGIGVAHFMGTLAQADAAGLIRYKTRGGGRKGERAGYYPTDNWAPIKGVYESNSDMMNFLI